MRPEPRSPKPLCPGPIAIRGANNSEQVVVGPEDMTLEMIEIIKQHREATVFFESWPSPYNAQRVNACFDMIKLKARRSQFLKMESEENVEA